MKTENYLRELYSILFSQKRIILATTLVILIAAVLISFLWPPMYSASGTVLVRGKKLEKSPEAIERVELRPIQSLTKEDLLSEAQMLTSADVIELTIKDLKTRNLYRNRNGSSAVEEVYALKNGLKTEIVPTSNIIEISFFDRDREFALNFLQSLMEQFVAYRLRIYNPNQAEAFFTQQADAYRGRLEAKEKELMELIEKNRVPDPQKELENNLLVKADLDRQLNALKTEAIEKNQYVEHLERGLRNRDAHYFSFVDNRPINELSGKLQDLFVERGKVLRSYSAQSDKVKLIDRHIEDTFDLLRAEVNAYKDNYARRLQIIREKITSLRQRINEIEAHNVQLKKQTLDQRRIETEANLYQSSYETFSKRREESKTLTAENVPSYISIASKAFPSDGPVFPVKHVVIPLGVLIGLVTGCSFGFVRHYFDHTFKKPGDVENYAGLPVLFSIPNWEQKRSGVKVGTLLIVLVLSVFAVASSTGRHAQGPVTTPHQNIRDALLPAPQEEAPSPGTLAVPVVSGERENSGDVGINIHIPFESGSLIRCCDSGETLVVLAREFLFSATAGSPFHAPRPGTVAQLSVPQEREVESLVAR